MTGTKFAFKLSIHGQFPDTGFPELVGLTRHAEEAGFVGVSVVDHLLLPGARLSGYSEAPVDKPYFLDAWTSLAALGQATEQVQVGPQVTPIGLRHPVFVAKWGATVDRITGGRLLLQAGAGHQRIEYESHGLPFPPLADRIEALEEGIDIIRALWSSDEPVSFEGRHYQLRDVPFWPKPIQSQPDIWLGGASKRIREVVAARADGWSPAAPQGKGLDSSFYRDALEEIRGMAREAGRTSHITGGALFYCILADDRSELAGYLDLLRRREDWAGLELEDIQGRGIALAGTPDEVAERIAAFRDAGVEYFTIAFPPISDIARNHESVERFADHVMPHFQGTDAG